MTSYDVSSQDDVPCDTTKIANFRFLHFTEGKRVITIANTYDKTTGLVQYGACIWKVDEKSPTWNNQHRKTSNSTAFGRFKKYPITVVVDTTLSYYDRSRQLRSYVSIFGVRSHSVEDLLISTNSHENLTTAFQNMLKHCRKTGGRFVSFSIGENGRFVFKYHDRRTKILCMSTNFM